MSKAIDIEQKTSEQFKLILEKDNETVQLSLHNVALVEAFICYDSDYSQSGNINATPDKKHQGSTAFWMTELKKHLLSGRSSYPYDVVVKNAVEAVDRENSTHINADGVGREELAKRLLAISKTDLVKHLKDPSKSDYLLVKILSERTKPKDKRKYARENYSFATKFCHYACMWLFEGLEEQDNFSIYDSIVSKAISRYSKLYKISYKSSDLRDYGKYMTLIGKIISASKSAISRNGFDHLLWYYYKSI